MVDEREELERRAWAMLQAPQITGSPGDGSKGTPVAFGFEALQKVVVSLLATIGRLSGEVNMGRATLATRDRELAEAQKENKRLIEAAYQLIGSGAPSNNEAAQWMWRRASKALSKAEKKGAPAKQPLVCPWHGPVTGETTPCCLRVCLPASEGES